MDADSLGETIDDDQRSKMPDVHEKVDALPALIAPRTISDIKVISRTGHTLKVSLYQYTWPTVGALRLQPTALLKSAVWVDKLVAEVVEQHRLDVTEHPFQGAYLGRLKQATKTSAAGELGPYLTEKRSGFSVFVGIWDFTVSVMLADGARQWNVKEHSFLQLRAGTLRAFMHTHSVLHFALLQFGDPDAPLPSAIDAPREVYEHTHTHTLWHCVSHTHTHTHRHTHTHTRTHRHTQTHTHPL